MSESAVGISPLLPPMYIFVIDKEHVCALVLSVIFYCHFLDGRNEDPTVKIGKEKQKKAEKGAWVYVFKLIATYLTH